MLPDPFPLFTVMGINAAAFSSGATIDSTHYKCISRNDTNSTYRYTISSTHWIDVFVGHQYGKRNRFVVKFTEVELVPDPTDTSVNVQKSTSYALTADRSVLGAATNEAGILSSLCSLGITLTDATPIFIGRVLVGET